MIITPSIVISDLEQINKNETYEVMMTQTSQQPFSNTDKGQFDDTHASFNQRAPDMGSVSGQSQNRKQQSLPRQ